jgi:hypothetical protein
MILSTRLPGRLLPAIAGLLLAIGVAACATSPGARSTGIASPSDVPSGAAPNVSAEPSSVPSDVPSPTDAPGASEGGGGTTSGDVPDNAVFLTHRDAALGFSIDYVEGWQVRQAPDGVIIKDKDSSEIVSIIATPPDLAGYVSGTDLPALRGQAGFKLIGQDTVKVGTQKLIHLRYHLPSPPDPVTGKRVASTVDRYYVPGSSGVAVVSLSTPDGVDNVDAFRQMIESFKWT